MVVNEKGLLKAMSEAASHGGFKIHFDKTDRSTVIQTDEWLVSILDHAIPRKVLGMIAEYFGKIPETGCYCVFKYKQEYEIQTYLIETFKADIRNLAMGFEQKAIYTGMQLWGRFIYVSEEGELLGAKPENLTLLEATFLPTQIIPGKSLRCMDDESTIYIRLFDSSHLIPAQQAIWGSLVAIDWWEQKETETRNRPDTDAIQMELAERDETEGGDGN